MSDIYFEGSGSDIRWCGRYDMGHKCLSCGRHANFEEWSKSWKWYYISVWSDEDSWYYKNHANHFAYRKPRFGLRFSRWVRPFSYPDRYKTVGLSEYEFRSLLKHGCKPNRKCRCVSVAQRAAWFCPECYDLISRQAQVMQVSKHKLILTNRKELRSALLVSALSGII